MAKRPKKRAKRRPKAKSDELPAHVRGRPDLEAAHVNRPVRNCPCDQCRTHRTLNRQAARDAAMAAVANFASGGMTVKAGQNATRALKDALGAS